MSECVRTLTYMANCMVQQNEFKALQRMIESSVITELHRALCRYQANTTSTHILWNCVLLLNALASSQ